VVRVHPGEPNSRALSWAYERSPEGGLFLYVGPAAVASSDTVDISRVESGRLEN